MTRKENKSYYYYLYDMSLLETIEFTFEDVAIKYYDDIINIFSSERGEDYSIAWHGVAKC